MRPERDGARGWRSRKTTKYVKTLAKTQEAPDRCLSRKRQREEIMMCMYPRTAQDAICYHIWWRRGTCSPRGKEQYIRPAALSALRELKYLDPCTWAAESSSYHTYINTWSTPYGGGKGRYWNLLFCSVGRAAATARALLVFGVDGGKAGQSLSP